MRRIALLCCMPLLAACSASLILGEPPSEKPRCPSQTGQSAQEVSPGVLLMAQSVRSASWLPCINTLPVGFSYERLDATDRGAHFWLNAGAEGTHAVRVALSRSCDLQGAHETTSERNGHHRPAAARLQRRATRPGSDLSRGHPMTRSTPSALYVRTGSATTPLAVDRRGAVRRQPLAGPDDRARPRCAPWEAHVTHSPARGSRLTCVRLGTARHGRQP